MNIIINGITDHIIVGCGDFEKQNKQLVIMDLHCELYQNTWYKDDELSNTLDYSKLIPFAQKMLSKKTYNLVEGVCQFVALEILKEFKQIKSIRVDLVKSSLLGRYSKEIKITYFTQRIFKLALALGSNHDFLPQQQVITATELLAEYITDIKFGGFYQTKPFGGVRKNDFINTAIIGTTILTPRELMSKIKYIEKLMGKTELVVNSPRIIDIDIIFFDDQMYADNFLMIPHKDMHNRDFVLKPLVDVAENWIHPKLNLSVLELYNRLTLEQKTNIIKSVPYYKDEI